MCVCGPGGKFDQFIFLALRGKALRQLNIKSDLLPVFKPELFTRQRSLPGCSLSGVPALAGVNLI